MKQKKLTKVFLMLVIILISCCIKTISYASTYEEEQRTLINGGSVWLDSTDLMNSPFIFCRHRGSILYGGQYKVKHSVEYPIIQYYKDKDKTIKTDSIEEAESVSVEGADIAYILSKYARYPKPSSGYGPIQEAYWAILSQEKYTNYKDQSTDRNGIYYNFTYSTMNGTEARKLYDEAIGYQKYIEKVEMQKIENKNNRNDSDFVFSSPIDSNKDADGYQISLFTGDADTVFNNNIMTIGPFKTKYARSI